MPPIRAATVTGAITGLIDRQWSSRWWSRQTLAKQQLLKRPTLPFLRRTLDVFNQGNLDAATAAQLLNVSRAHLFRLRAAWLQHPATFSFHLSGGDHRAGWPDDVRQFLQAFLPRQRPPNYQLVADELAGRLAFQRDRKSVAASLCQVRQAARDPQETETKEAERTPVSPASFGSKARGQWVAPIMAQRNPLHPPAG